MTTVGLRERHKVQRIRQILDATRSLLREGADESPSVERIAERAEVAPATVYNLVGPRERILAALADELLQELERRIEAMPAGDPHARARSIVAEAADLTCADPRVHRHMLSSWRWSGRLLHRNPTSHLRECLQAAVGEGSLRDDLDLGTLADMVATACIGAAHQWAAELIDDGTFRSRCVMAVDIVFAAAQSAGD